jgi:hypothetical protein
MSGIRKLYVIAVLVLAGCSDQHDIAIGEQAHKNHLLQDQARALEKAKGVEQGMRDASARQREHIDGEDK